MLPTSTKEDPRKPISTQSTKTTTASSSSSLSVSSGANEGEYAAVLKRLEEVAFQEYPFPMLPEEKRPTVPKDQKINLFSFPNLKPMLIGLVLFGFKMYQPIFVIGLILMGYMFPKSSTIFYSLAVSAVVTIWFHDPFLVHWLTNGKFGGLGKGDTSTSNNNKENELKTGFISNTTNARNNYIQSKMEHHAMEYRPTPYLYSGDLLTLIPFLLFKGSIGGKVHYQRYWIKVPNAPAPDGPKGPSKLPKQGNNNDDVDDDNEAVALDIVFPPTGYDSSKSTFLILHGLNGGSTEPYVLDLARKGTSQGHTVVVMIARGLMKTPVKGMNSFTGSRTSDVGCAVDVLLHALGGKPRYSKSSSSSSKKQQPPIVLVGFSMGGIIAANYVAKSETDKTGLVGAISFSGSICSNKMLLDTPAAKHSIQIWQPPLAWGLKGTIVKPNMTNLIKRGITKQFVEDHIHTVYDIDSILVCKYHGYESIQDYYEDNSAAGKGDEEGLKRLNSVDIPLLLVHAMDDPIAIYEVVLAEEIPKTQNVMLLATKHGGHIGWPTGIFPSQNRWNYMIDIAMEYATTVVDAPSDE